MNLISLNNAGIQNRRGIVIGVDAVERIAYDGEAQIALDISLTDTFFYGVFQQTAGDMNVLTDLNKNDCHTGILTDRHTVCGGDITVLDHFAEDFTADRRFFFFLSVNVGLTNIGRQNIVCIHAKITNQFGDVFRFNCTHLLFLL